jgi:hypothetical protein
MADQVEGLTTQASYQAVGTPRVLSMDELGGLKVSGLLPAYYDLARQGKIFACTHTVATAEAPLQVVPTTTAALVVNNVDTSTSAKVCVVLQAGIFLGSGTSGIGATLYGQVGSTPLATQLSADTSGVTRTNGRGGADSSVAYVGISKTVAGGWTQLGSYDCAAAAVVGQGLVVPLHGMFVVRPTYAFGLHAVAPAGTTAKFVFSVIWAEVQGTTP